MRRMHVTGRVGAVMRRGGAQEILRVTHQNYETWDRALSALRRTDPFTSKH